MSRLKPVEVITRVIDLDFGSLRGDPGAGLVSNEATVHAFFVSSNRKSPDVVDSMSYLIYRLEALSDHDFYFILRNANPRSLAFL